MWTRRGSAGRGLGVWNRGARRRALWDDVVEDWSSCRRACSRCCWRWRGRVSGKSWAVGWVAGCSVVGTLAAPPRGAGVVDKVKGHHGGGDGDGIVRWQELCAGGVRPVEGGRWRVWCGGKRVWCVGGSELLSHVPDVCLVCVNNVALKTETARGRETRALGIAGSRLVWARSWGQRCARCSKKGGRSGLSKVRWLGARPELLGREGPAGPGPDFGGGRLGDAAKSKLEPSTPAFFFDVKINLRVSLALA